ncbi:MAG: helix-turn-helix transcriptional regulator [Clostridia bacterium]|nr:helix-turn-helix transcriptional regulator [Clostridia bacterium]
MENHELVTKALGYIDRSFRSGDMTIEAIAAKAGFSTDYFNRIFRAHTGFSVMEYVRFRRLSDAAVRLRQSGAGVLDIGLAVGYDSHDGFTRAFKAQYGKTPSEYREAMAHTPVCFADLNLNATASARMAKALPGFHPVASDEAVDYLLALDARRYGYDAVTILWNGTCVLTDGDLARDGCYVGADMFFDDKPYLYLHVRKLDELRRYAALLTRLKPSVIHTQIEEPADGDAVVQALDGIGCTVSPFEQHMYFGGEAGLPASPYTFRFLEKEDAAVTLAWQKQASVGWRMERTMEIPREDRPFDLPIGMFDGERLIGVARAGIQTAHGFVINNCIVPAIFAEHASPENYRLFYAACMNLLLPCGCVLYEDMLTGRNSEKCGNLTAPAMGYEKVNTAWLAEFK